MKRYAGYLATVLGILVLAVFSARGVRAAVTPVPGAVSVVGGRPATVTVTYRFTGLQVFDASPFNGVVTSTDGQFFTSSGVIGAIFSPVSATITGGAGQVSETFTIPLSVLNTLRSEGAAQMKFQRVFTGFNLPLDQDMVLTISVTGEAAAAFGIKRIELYFENRRGETTVTRNQRGLKAFADIRFTGSGVLTGFWEVDGRRILDVNRQLNFGTNVTLSTPDVPDLPTFNTGTHIVRLVITNPPPAGPLPQLLYFVTAGKEVRSIRIAVPEGDGMPATHSFSWAKPAGMDFFFLEFSEEAGGKPLFSAFTKEGSYKLPDQGLEGIFTPGKRYFWRVKGYDASDSHVGESEATPFQY